MRSFGRSAPRLRLLCALLSWCWACNAEDGSGDTDTDTDTDTDASAGSFSSSRTASDSASGPPSTFTNTSDSTSGSDSDPDSDPSSASQSSDDTGSEESGQVETSGSSSTSGGTGSTGDPTGSSDTEADTTGAPPGGDCCSAHDEPGCSVASVESCVCEEDPVCCELFWDDACTVKVMALGCGECPGLGGDGDCCMDNGTPGCDDDAIENCVCLQDIACCLESWDSICAQGVEMFDCGQC